jgi:hypothetical protein
MKNRYIDAFPPPAETFTKEDRETVMTEMDKEFMNNSYDPFKSLTKTEILAGGEPT